MYKSCCLFEYLDIVNFQIIVALLNRRQDIPTSAKFIAAQIADWSVDQAEFGARARFNVVAFVTLRHVSFNSTFSLLIFSLKNNQWQYLFEAMIRATHDRWVTFFKSGRKRKNEFVRVERWWGVCALQGSTWVEVSKESLKKNMIWFFLELILFLNWRISLKIL